MIAVPSVIRRAEAGSGTADISVAVLSSFKLLGKQWESEVYEELLEYRLS
jgi:hypothetical protein